MRYSLCETQVEWIRDRKRRFESGHHRLHFGESSMSSDREQNRQRQRRFKQRHAVRLASEAEHRTSVRDSAVGRRPSHRVIELVHSAGEFAGLPALVVVVRAGQRVDIEGLTEDQRWLPNVTMPLATARRVRSHRLSQIIEWCGLQRGERPEWLRLRNRKK